MMKELLVMLQSQNQDLGLVLVRRQQQLRGLKLSQQPLLALQPLRLLLEYQRKSLLAQK